MARPPGALPSAPRTHPPPQTPEQNRAALAGWQNRALTVNLNVSGGFIPTDPEWPADVIGERVVEAITEAEESALATTGVEGPGFD